jgi:endonuclease/exonuclease/phosphatase family metal-dependent hydrolase
MNGFRIATFNIHKGRGLDGRTRVERIGRVLGIEKDQKKDIKLGEEAVRDLKRTGLIPKEIEDEAVAGYVKRISQKLAANSDLQVP